MILIDLWFDEWVGLQILDGVYPIYTQLPSATDSTPMA